MGLVQDSTLVYATLMSSNDNRGGTCPSVTDLMAPSGLSRPTVQKALRVLENRLAIAQRQTDNNGGSLPNR